MRQSKLYREHVGGNAMKDIMGQDDLKWQTDRCEGVYAGMTVHDHNSLAPGSRASQAVAAPAPTTAVVNEPAPSMMQPMAVAPAQPRPSAAPVASQEAQPPGHRRGAGYANKQSYNLLTGADN